MSVAIITCRRLPRRSTHTPAWSAKRRFGTSAAVSSAPICAGVASSASTAVSGSAISVTWSPTSETACPMKYRRKLWFSRRISGSTRALNLTRCSANLANLVVARAVPRSSRAGEPRQRLSVDGEGGLVEDEAHLAREVVRAERLLQECDARLEDAVVVD